MYINYAWSVRRLRLHLTYTRWSCVTLLANLRHSSITSCVDEPGVTTPRLRWRSNRSTISSQTSCYKHNNKLYNRAIGSENKFLKTCKNLWGARIKIERKIEIKKKHIRDTICLTWKTLNARVKIMGCPGQRNNSTIINKNNINFIKR